MAVTRRKRGTSGPIPTTRETRARAAVARRRRPDYTAAQAEAARARLDPLYGLAIVEDDPFAPDAGYYADLESDVPPMVQDMGARADRDSRKPRPRKTARTLPAAPVAISRTPTARLICPRCGRTDWRANGVGLRWHLDNYPACASSRKADHAYIQIGA